MAAEISPQPLVVGEIDLNIISTDAKEGLKPSFASVTQLKQIQTNLDLFKVNFDHEVPKILFTMEDVNNFTREEGLHQAVVVKFSYGRPELSEVRRIFSSLFDVKGHCIIGQLEYRHLLVRFDLFNDYVQFLSKSTGYLKSKGDDYFFRTFPWSFGFNPKEETSMAVVWISLPGLPPNLFAKRSILSIASAVGKPLAIDKVTQDRSRPSAARVKVILNLLDKHPEKVTLQFLDSDSGKTFEFHQQIVYDNLPKYCVFCKHQGHEDKVCRVKNQKNRSEEEADENLSSGQGKHVTTIWDNVVKLQGDARDYLNKKKEGQVDITHNIAKGKEGGNRIYVPVLKSAQQNADSIVRPLAVTEKESMDLLLKDDKVAQAADTEGIIDEGRNLESQSLNTISELPLHNDNSGQSIAPNGQSDKSVNSTVALKLIAENYQGSGKQLSHAYLHNLPAVIDKRNSESLLILKGDGTVSNAADQERAIVEAMIPTVNEFQAANVGSDLQVISTDHYGQLNDPNGQTSQFLSSLTPTVALDVTSESDKGKGQQLIPAVNDKGVSQAADQERAKDEVKDTSGQSNCTVALDAIDESDKGSSQQVRHAVIDKGNTEFQVNLKGYATVTQAADQDSAMDEVMIPTVYGQLINHSGQPNQMLSSLNSTVALQVIPDFDKRNAQELRHAGIPAVTVNSELLVNMKDAATVSHPADPDRAKQTNTVALDTIAEDKQSSSHHEKAVAINREHTEVYLQPKENLSVPNTPFVPKNTGQLIYDQVTSENAANQQNQGILRRTPIRMQDHNKTRIIFSREQQNRKQNILGKLLEEGFRK